MTKSSYLEAVKTASKKLELVYRPYPKCQRDFYRSEAELNLIDPPADKAVVRAFQKAGVPNVLGDSLATSFPGLLRT